MIVPFSRRHFDRMYYLIRGQVKLLGNLFAGIFLVLGILFLMVFFGVSDDK